MVVTITLREIYDAIVRQTGRLDVLVEQNGAMSTDLSDHETRIRQLERGRWPLPAVAVLLSVASLVITVWLSR